MFAEWATNSAEYRSKMEHRDLFGTVVPVNDSGPMARTFAYPPFSVMSARDGWWQERKRQWLALGIQSELGRGVVLGGDKGDVRQGAEAARGARGMLDLPQHYRQAALNGLHAKDMLDNSQVWVDATRFGASVFDPVLCELMYRWFCPSGGSVLDPFAGGSVRGIVASLLGLTYVGVDLSVEQVKANRQQAEAICTIGGGTPGPWPLWRVGDSQDLASLVGAYRPDFVFSCPPYFNLEEYSDDPRDISTMDWDDFCAAYSRIIRAAIDQLQPNRFACFVVSDVRKPDGNYCWLPGATIAAFAQAGAALYNEGILVTPAGSLMMRAGRQFKHGRKLGRSHQTVLVFCKGSWRAATEACNAGKSVDNWLGLGQVDDLDPDGPVFL